MFARTVCLLLIALCSCTAEDTPDPAPPSPVQRVSVGRTPGKPMELVKQGEPAEQIEARQTKDGFELVVTRNVGSAPEDYAQTVVPLSKDEWGGILALIEAQALRTWKPKPETGRVYDYGGVKLEIKTAQQTLAHAWSKPLENKEPVNALFRHLGALAKEKAKQPQLYYFGG